MIQLVGQTRTVTLWAEFSSYEIELDVEFSVTFTSSCTDMVQLPPFDIPNTITAKVGETVVKTFGVYMQTFYGLDTYCGGLGLNFDIPLSFLSNSWNRGQYEMNLEPTEESQVGVYELVMSSRYPLYDQIDEIYRP